MATIRELRAKFTAESRGMTSALRDVRREMSGLGPDAQRSTDTVNRSYTNLIRTTERLQTAISQSDDASAFNDLERAAQNVQRELEDIGTVTESSMQDFERAVREGSQQLDGLDDAARASMTAIERAVTDVNGDLRDLGRANSLDNLSGDLNNATDDIEDLSHELDDAGDAADRASGDIRDFGDTSEREADRSERGFGKLGKALGGLVGIVAGAFAVDAIKDFGTELAATAGGAEASKAQFTTVFGDMEEEATARLSAIGDEATILDNRMKDSFTKIAAFAKTGGMDTATSLDLADRSMRAIADSAAFYDRSLEDVTESLQSYLKGNYENDAALGLSSTETTRNAAANKLYGKSFKDLAEDQKQLTLLQMVEDANKLTGAIGQASRESEGWENVVGNMNQAWTDFKAGIGAPVLKVAVGLLKGMTASVQALNTEAIGNGIESAFDFISGAIGRAREAIKPFASALFELKDFITGSGSAEGVIEALGMDPEKSQAAVSTLKFIKDAAADAWQSFKDGKAYVEAVFALFRNQDGTAIDLMAKLGMSVEERQKVMDAVQAIQDKVSAVGEKVSNALAPAREAIKGIFALITNQDGTAISIFHKLGLNPDQIGAIMNAVDSVKNVFGNLWAVLVGLAETHGANLAQKWQMISAGAIAVFNYLMPIIRPALEAVLQFAAGIIGKIADFWKSDGETIIQAVQNLGKVIGVIFYGIMKVVQFVMPAVMAIIKSIWGNIKGVITGALDIIMGAVKIFSGLFTGDFAKMWEGVKQLFFGAVNFLWNFVQLTFFGKILGGAKVFFSLFRSGFAAMWAGVRALFTGSISGLTSNVSAGWRIISAATKDAFNIIFLFLKNIFSSIKSITTGFINAVKLVFSKGWSFLTSATRTAFNGLWTIIKGIFGLMRTGFQTYINFYRNIISGGWTFIRNLTQTVFSRIWAIVKGIFSTMQTWLSNTTSAIGRTISGVWTALKNTTSNTFRDIFNAIKSRFTDIVNAAKELPGRIGAGIGSMASKVNAGVTKVINALATTLGKGVNGVIGGINWVLGKIGVDDKNDVPLWKVPQYAKGTPNTRGGHPGGLAIVNDGRGPEMIQEPDGSTYMLKGKNVMTNLPKGSTVWAAEKTKEMLEMIPQYKNGTIDAAGKFIKDTWNSGKEKVQAVGGKVKDAVVNAFDYIKKPGAFLDLALKTLGIEKPKGGSFIGNMAAGGFNKVKNLATDFVKKKLEGFGLTQSGISITGGNGGGFGAPYRLTSKPGPRNTGIPGASTFHKGWDWAAPTGTPIPSVTDGVVSRNSWHPLSGNFIEIRDSSGRVHRYQHNSKNLAKVGQQVKKGQTIGLVGMTGVGSGPHLHYELKGYEKGGVINKEQVAKLGEGGKKEVVIPLEQHRSRALGLYKMAGKALGVSDSKMAVLYNEQTQVIKALQDIASTVKAISSGSASLLQKASQMVTLLTAVKGHVNTSSSGSDYSEPKATAAKTTTSKTSPIGSPVRLSPKAQAEALKKKRDAEALAKKKAAEALAKKKKAEALAAHKKSLTNKINSYKIKLGKSAVDYFDAIESGSKANNKFARFLPAQFKQPVMKLGSYLANLDGYVNGGIVSGKFGAQLAWLTEGGWSESVISHDPSKKSSQRAIWEETGRKLGFNTDDNAVLEVLERIAQGVHSGRDLQIIMDSRVVGQAVEPHVSEQQDIKTKRNKTFRR